MKKTIKPKTVDRNIRRVNVVGNGSFYVTIPIDMVRKLKINTLDTVIFSCIGERISFVKVPTH